MKWKQFPDFVEKAVALAIIDNHSIIEHLDKSSR